MMMRFFILAGFILTPMFALPETALDFAGAGRMAVAASAELRNEYAAKSLRERSWTWGARAYFPKLGFSASEDDRVSEVGNDSFLKNYSVNLEQLLWDGGRLSMARKQEKAEIEFSSERLRQAALDIAEAAIDSYRDVLRGRRILEIKEKSLEALEEQRLIMRREAELGLARQVDLVEADITVALAELEILSHSADLEEAEWRLAEKLGLEKLPLLSETIQTGRSPGLPAPDRAASLAEARNPGLAVIRSSIARRLGELKAASLSWIPALRFTGSFGLSGRRYPLSRYTWSVGISIDFSSPWISGSFGAGAGREPPYDRNAKLHQSLNPAPEPGAVFSVKSAELALTYERTKYETARSEIYDAAERAVRKCSLLDKRRLLAAEALTLEAEKSRLAELNLSLGEITRLDLMETRLEYTMRETDLVEAAIAVLRAERELERLLDIGPGELSVMVERDLI